MSSAYEVPLNEDNRLKPVEYAILGVLYQHPEWLTARQIANELGLSARSVATRLCWMRGKGLVYGSARTGWGEM